MLRQFYVCILAAAAQAAVTAEESRDVTAMQGTWTPVKAELAGEPTPEAVLKTIVLKIDGGNYEVSVGGKLDRGTCALDSIARPKGMTITGTDGPNKGKTFRCIYELDGDTLRVCYDLAGQKAPTDFATAAGTKLYLVTYARKKE